SGVPRDAYGGGQAPALADSRNATARHGAGLSLETRVAGSPRPDQRPSSNTTSSETETLLSPGATGVLSKASAFIIAIRGIGIGALPPSPMLTIRRTRSPSALA